MASRPLPTPHYFYLREKFGGMNGLQKKMEVVALSAGSFEEIQRGYLSRKQQDFTRGVLRLHADRKVNPGKAGHIDIRYEQIRSSGPGGGQRLERGSEEPCRVPVHFQYGGKRGSDDMFIVYNDDAWS